LIRQLPGSQKACPEPIDGRPRWKTPALHLTVIEKIVSFFGFGLNLRGSACQDEAYVPFYNDGF